MKKILSAFVYVILLAMIYIMCIRFDLISNSVKNAFEMCINSVIPSLFPFFIISDILQKNMMNHSKGNISTLYERIFKFSKSTMPVFIAGLISGYPVGAYMVHNLYEKKLISKSDANDLICFTNNSGPLFIICTVGIAMYKSISIGLMLYIIHITSAIITGLTVSFTRTKTNYNSTYFIYETNDISILIEKAFFKCIKICGFIIFFSIINCFIDILFYKWKDLSVYASVLAEITNGINKAAAYFETQKSLCVASFSLSFSGLSVLLQVKSICSGKIPIKKYVFYKLYNGCISYIICAMYFKIKADILFLVCIVYVFVIVTYSRNKNNIMKKHTKKQAVPAPDSRAKFDYHLIPRTKKRNFL